VASWLSMRGFGMTDTPKYRPNERDAEHWGFISDDNLEIALFYEYDDERKPLKISNIPIEHDTSIYADEIKKSINTFYGSEISPVEYMAINFDNFRTFTDYVCNTDHSIEMSLNMKNMTTGDATVTAETRTEGCYFFREDEDYIYDIFYDQYEEIIEGFEDLRYNEQRDIKNEVMGKINGMVNERLKDLKVKDSPIYGQEWKFETAHKVTINNKLFIIHLVFEVKL
jgi:hypothetical protein